VLRVAMRAAVNMLTFGAQSDDVETAIVSVCAAYGLMPVHAAVTFSIISVSYDRPGESPTTLMHIARDRTTDFARLAATSAIVRRITRQGLGLEQAEHELEDIDQLDSPYNQLVTFVAPAVSAAGSTLVFAGTLLDAAATLGIALAIQPAVAALDRSTFPPFFRLVFGAFASAILVALLSAVGLPIVGGLVLTGSILRFLPGYAIVSGFRDLIGQSFISGTARLAEALLLGAGAAGGIAFALALAGRFGVNLTIITAGTAEWGLLVGVPAAFVAILGYAVRLGVPPRGVLGAAGLGALAWLIVIAIVDVGNLADRATATFVAALVVGIVGRVAASRAHTPAALWVVPAILLLQPGLQIVQSMLAPTNGERLAGLIAAAVTAFMLGTGVASGDIIVTTARRIRTKVVEPAVDAMSGGVDVFVVTPVERAVNRAAERFGRNRRDG
jgi:uncharacterized membrane protein YjjP (DUF1212 family)